ncbi:Calcineurin-like_phosphoesterase superfamily domain-containing protein [Hexamita inflata]|uniref:Calcineurin-like_phosphoesterase superfamily domain-containing protein n=1 Tax=Hexamita inflata TaxID=28002 RepID=A0ABP1GGP4_9EUKA
MKILFFTDLHDNSVYFEQLLSKIPSIEPDLIIVGGDFQTLLRSEMDQEQIIQSNNQSINGYIDKLQEIAQTLYVLGNHDCVNSHSSRNYLNMPRQLSNQLTIVPQSGASTTLPVNIDNQELRIGWNFWEGYPYGPTHDEDLTELKQFFHPNLESNTEVIKNMKQTERVPLPNNSKFNEEQQFQEVPKSQLLVVSHQGPYGSATACDVAYGLHFSSGSPQNEHYYLENEEDIALWLHGHTHYPKFQAAGKCVNPGTFIEGNYAVIELEEVNGRWAVQRLAFDKVQ